MHLPESTLLGGPYIHRCTLLASMVSPHVGKSLALPLVLPVQMLWGFPNFETGGNRPWSRITAGLFEPPRGHTTTKSEIHSGSRLAAVALSESSDPSAQQN